MTKYIYEHLEGKRFGRLVVLCKSKERNSAGHICWHCICNCGNYKTVSGAFLKRGDTKSCGCYRREFGSLIGRRITIKHGDAGKGKKRNKLYSVWASIKSKCTNPTDTGYGIYGGRGITYCDGWNDYLVFKEWALANGYAMGMAIHRVNHDGNYEPDNCQWMVGREHRSHHAKLRRRDGGRRFL